jgi:hypothetical protein
MPSNTPETQAPALVEVSQAARDAAADYIGPLSGRQTDARLRSGKNDHVSIVQAFARFERDILARQSSSNAGGVDVEAVARALFVFQHQGDIADPGRTWDAPEKGEHPLYWQKKMEHNHPHYRAMARAALASLSTPTAEPMGGRGSEGNHQKCQHSLSVEGGRASNGNHPIGDAQPVDETERLRSALREIAEDPYKHGQRIQKMKAIARAALQHKGEASRG